MSKERLEELAYHVAATSDGKAVMGGEDYAFLYEYALEQSERVQELESKLKKEKKSHKKTRQQFNRYKRSVSENWRAQRATQNESIMHQNVKEIFREQNERYHEALERISEYDVYNIDIVVAGEIAKRVLEENK